MTEWVLATFIVFLASVVQAATGFGFSIMATPFLLLVFNSHDAVQVNIIISLFISVVLIPGIWKEVDKVLLKRLVLGSSIGVPLGTILFAHFSIPLLKLTVSIVVLALTAFLFIKNHINGKCPDETSESKASSPVVNEQLKRNELFVGLCAGALTTSIGMPGPPLLLYFNSKNVKKEVLRSTTLAFFIFVYIVSLIFQMITVAANYSVITISLTLIPVAVVGILLGSALFRWVNQKLFNTITYIILLYTGMYMLIKTLSS